MFFFSLLSAQATWWRVIGLTLVATTQPLPGVQQSHNDNAAHILNELHITNAKHRQPILASAAPAAEVNRYNQDLKTGKIKASRNPGGLLLVRLGLVAPKIHRSKSKKGPQSKLTLR